MMLPARRRATDGDATTEHASPRLRAIPAQDPVGPRLIEPLPDKPLVSFEGVWRYWGRGSNRWAVLRDINLHIERGAAVCITGPNGAGKTTLLRIATGVLAADRGTVRIGGVEPRRSWREYHRQIGFLSAGDRGLYARVSVSGHLEYWTALAFVPRPERKRLVQEALLRFGLSEFAERRADRLSQGERQRLRLALALVHEPTVLLLDEPRNSLDAEGLEVLSSAVGELLVGGGAVISCSPMGEDQPLAFSQTLLIGNGGLTPA